jgi:hypothetical protein
MLARCDWSTHRVQLPRDVQSSLRLVEILITAEARELGVRGASNARGFQTDTEYCMQHNLG